jgi:mannose-6-phosphate isomerase-like protein (cupin superfamily)
MARITMFVDYKSDAPPIVPKPDYPTDPYVLSVLDGIPVRYPEFQGLGVRVVHPSNPRAPARNMALEMLYLPPHVGGWSGPSRTERAYLVLEGQGRMTFANFQRDVGRGDFVFLPPGCGHALENSASEMLVLIVATGKPESIANNSSQVPELVGYQTDEIPAIPKSDPNVEPRVLSARDGVPVKYPNFDGLGIRVVHPVNPKAPSTEFGMVLVYLPPHTELEFGSHPTEETYLILEGQGRMHSSRVERGMKKGDFVHLPPWCIHSLRNSGTGTCVALVVASPPNP